ncbi:hypothetical protein [Aeoliella sp.]|uniref:hypothetical protein n=1 Tax=Aeoliella sp. TaxID=2795800 RepID=UPI003CCC00B6
MMLVVSAALVLIMVPGEESRCYENPATVWQLECREAWQQSFERHANEDADMRVYEHGWPMPCAARAIYTGDRFENLLILVEQQVSEVYTEKRAVSWTRRRSWPLDGEEWRIRWWAVIVDLALFCAVIALVIWSTERWLRRRGGLLRFRVVDLLVGMAVFGVLIGWYTANARQRQLELELSELFDLKVSPSPFHGGNYGRWRYEGPVWLRKLVGNAGNLQAFWRRTEADLRMNANWKDDICELSRFAQLEKVSIEGALTYDALAELKSLPHLETLKLDSFGNSSIEEAMRWRFDPERDLVLGDRSYGPSAAGNQRTGTVG